MSRAQIQGAILGTVGEQWAKVAMVIAKVAHAMSQDLPAGEEGYEAIAREIELFVQDRRLVVRGNIKDWRFSEVRRAGLEEISGYRSDN